MNSLFNAVGATKKYRTFISHAWAYKDSYRAIRQMLDRAQAEYPSFYYVDYSIPDHNPLLTQSGNVLFGERNLSNRIKTRIGQSSVVIVPARMFVNSSGWVQKEIRYARQLGKRVIAVRSRQTHRAPVELSIIADDTVDANYRSLHNAIVQRIAYRSRA